MTGVRMIFETTQVLFLQPSYSCRVLPTTVRKLLGGARPGTPPAAEQGLQIILFVG
jgi:hypothetical protein